MSNFAVNGIYNYTGQSVYYYLGMYPSNSTKLKEAFREYNITPTGKVDDLERLKRAMYSDYTKQVQTQMKNQKGEKKAPWHNVCAQIGIQATGDKENDKANFYKALNLLSQSAIDGQAMTFFATLRSQASSVFAEDNKVQTISYDTFKANFLK